MCPKSLTKKLSLPLFLFQTKNVVNGNKKKKVKIQIVKMR